MKACGTQFGTDVYKRQVGTHVVYWKVKSNGHSVTGSAVVEITPAHLTIKAHDKSAYVGDAVPVLGEDDYTVTGLVSDETLDTKRCV